MRGGVLNWLLLHQLSASNELNTSPLCQTGTEASPKTWEGSLWPFIFNRKHSDTHTCFLSILCSSPLPTSPFSFLPSFFNYFLSCHFSSICCPFVTFFFFLAYFQSPHLSFLHMLSLLSFPLIIYNIFCLHLFTYTPETFLRPFLSLFSLIYFLQTISFIQRLWPSVISSFSFFLSSVFPLLCSFIFPPLSSSCSCLRPDQKMLPFCFLLFFLFPLISLGWPRTWLTVSSRLIGKNE